MRIRFVTLYYPPEVGAAQRRISELARRLVKRGHEVTVVTGFPNYPSGVKPEKYRGRLFMRETMDGVNIIRLPHFVAPNKGFVKRLMIHLTYAFSTGVYSLFMRRDDIIYLESPPLFNGFIGLVSKWLRGVPYLFNVADLWPDTAVQLGQLNNKTIIRIASMLERLFYSQAKKILAITQGLQTSILGQGYAPDKVPLLTNGVDHELFHPAVEPDAEILSHKPEGGFLVVYAGTHGLIYSLDTVLDAAEMVAEKNIRFVFVGDGSDKDRIVKRARNMKLSNVTFLPPRKEEEIPSVFKAADATVICLKKLEISKAIMPLKCFENMAVGVPILYAAEGEMANHIEQAGCGMVIEPENPAVLAGALERFADMATEERHKVGLKGREFVVEHFTREKIAADLETIMQRAITDGE